MSAAGAAAVSTVFPRFAIAKSSASANGKLNVAFIGSGGWIAQQPYNGGCKDENLVAFCDVDRAVCAENMKNWRTNQPFYEDFRVMLDKMHKEIDAVVISTPDHTHFAATMDCMERGIHVYTQKPLTHTIWQARTLQKAKHKYNVMTQMGNQGHAGDGIRRSVEAYRAGLIGEVTEVYAGNDGPQMGGSHFCNPKTMPPPVSPVPDTLNWDLWLGPQKMRPFWSEYLPQKWRAVYDFGSGALGDWGCHTMDTPVWALDLDLPTKIECVTREKSLGGITPTSSHIRYSFPAKGSRGPVTLHWFDGPQDFKTAGRIDRFGVEHARSLGRACWMVGSKGLIGCGAHAGEPAIMPVDVRNVWKAKPPAETIPRTKCGNPFQEWLAAIKGSGPEPGSNFDYASKLTEIALLGVLAQRFNTTIDWDAKEGKITNHDELDGFVKEPAREGWDYGKSLHRESMLKGNWYRIPIADRS
jgi:hypothetical protein